MPTVTPVKDLADLRARVKGGRTVYAILLAGGLAYSRKTIRIRKGCWEIKNHIDNTTQHLCSDDELWTQSNIGTALDNGAFVQLEGGTTIKGSVQA